MEKHYILYTSFEDNNKLKQLGCRWCPEEKLWYCINSNLDEVKRNFNNIFSNNLFEKNNLQIEYINEIISKSNEIGIPENADNKFEEKYYSIYYSLINELHDYLTFDKYTKIKDKHYRINNGGRIILEEKYNGKFTFDEKKIWKKFNEYYKVPSFYDIVDTCKKIIDKQHISINGWKIANHNSKIQELFWKEKLQKLYPKITYQYKKGNCIFDFIDFENKIIFEAKLDYCNVVGSQFSKYRKMYPDFQIVYLIGINAVSYVNCFSEKYYDKLKKDYEDNYEIYKNNNYQGTSPKFPKEYNILYEYTLTNNEDLYEYINYYNKNFEDIMNLLKEQHKSAKINMINKCEYA
jgi:hypothetical protein